MRRARCKAVTDWINEVIKFGAGVITALTSVWIARIVRGGTLAETLRKEQSEIRTWLKQELDEVREEAEECGKNYARLVTIMDSVRSLLRLAVERRTGGLPFDIEMAAALAKLEQSDVPSNSR